MSMNSRRKLLLLASLILSLLLGKRYLRDQEELLLSDWFHPRNRPDVVTTADWLAPVVWEGTFDRKVLERYYRRQNLTVGLAVFAIGRAADQYLEPFLKSANKHFMTGHRVIIYIVVHRGYQVPPLQPDPLRTFKVVSVGQESWWPDLDLDLNLDLDLVRMKKLGELIVSHIRWEADFLFIMRVEQAFQGDVGLEILGTAVAQLHAWWYFQDEKNLPYERRPESAACIPYGEGDFFYDGAFVGGTPLQILSLVEAYLRGVFHDMKLGLKSTYERHLNKYFFLHKPTKLLSPEYGWDVVFPPPRQVRYVKVLQLAKRGP